MIKDYIRKELRNFRPYHAPYRQQKIKLDANESPFKLNDSIKSKLIQWINEEENLNLYPDTDSTELREAIASYWNVAIDNIIVGVGSDQLIDCMLRVLLDPGDTVVMPTPSFSMYSPTTIINHGIPVEVELGEDYSYPLDDIIKSARENNSKLIILCSPNNPTGNALHVEQVEQIAKNVSCPILFDEAYGEFCNETMIDLIDRYPNIVVLRTFSKAYGLAGLRVGYGISSIEMINAINLVKPPYNLNTISQKIATWVIQDANINKARIDYLKGELNYLFDELKKMHDMKVFPSAANFILIETRDLELVKKLEEKEIYVRSFRKGKEALLIRITIGTQEQNRELVHALKNIPRGIQNAR